MHIDNSTTPHQLVEWMGSATDERDGRILLGLLSREGVTDTDELTEDEWLGLLDEAASIRRTEAGDPPACRMERASISSRVLCWSSAATDPAHRAKRGAFAGR